MFSYYATYLIGRCEGEISLVRPFICVVPSLPPSSTLPRLWRLPSRAHVCAHCAK